MVANMITNSMLFEICEDVIRLYAVAMVNDLPAP